MGAEASKPQTGVKLQVIGAASPSTVCYIQPTIIKSIISRPRVAVRSIHSKTEAGSEDPDCANVYPKPEQRFFSPPSCTDGSTTAAPKTIVSGDETHITAWISILQHDPYRCLSDKAFVLDAFRTLTTGYVACADAPLAQVVPELQEINPDAIVLCTVRDPEAWVKSMGDTAGASLQALLAVMLFWVPCLRWLPRFLNAMMEGRYGELYRRAREGKVVMHGRAAWERHSKYLRSELPEEKLFLAPIGVEFPRNNDGKTTRGWRENRFGNG
ncbi:unnamed protein product [Zymoseptoria tritici ST99CH_3D7]|uniref:NAD dependent epimerase/dehydratase n=1 Tax=Zymoseptoria tritici (strain ST99CH_3D7) TaxID=1276538 RepID=A0A1X7RJ35_ZYMT9|nr:unnamed protein product [Zymoseptoria tritici ST99CH_3D7]